MKKILCFLMCGLIGISLTGCSSSDDNLKEEVKEEAKVSSEEKKKEEKKRMSSMLLLWNPWLQDLKKDGILQEIMIVLL